MLELMGNIGYQVGAAAVICFTVAFLVIIRWWTDLLGRLIAFILTTMSLVLIMTSLRMLGVELPGGLFAWRVVVFWMFGIGVWSALGVFIWAQFFAPRIKRMARMTTRREYRNEQEADVAAGRRDRDGDLHDGAGRAH